MQQPVRSADELLQELLTAKKRLKDYYQAPTWKEIPLLRSNNQITPQLTLDDCMQLVFTLPPLVKNKVEVKTHTVKILDIFKGNVKKILKIMLIGEMGSGKSVLTRLLTYQWAQGKILQEFDWIFHLDLKECVRKITETKSSISTCDELLQLMYFDFPKEQGNLVKDILKGKRVLLIVECDDEVALQCTYLIKSILEKKEYDCLFTSRPEKSSGLDNNIDLIIKNSGITTASIPIYIKNYFNLLASHAQGEDLLLWLQQQPLLMEICTTPIYLELICRLWRSEPAKLKANTDLSKVGLLEAFVDSLLEEHMVLKNRTADTLQGVNRDNLPEVILSRIFLERVAFLCTQQGELVSAFTYDLLQQAYDEVKNDILEEKIIDYLPEKKGIAKAIFKELKKLAEKEFKIDPSQFHVSLYDRLLASGIIKCEIQGNNNSNNRYSFPHAGLAEYLAASYISHHLRDAKDIIGRNKYHPSWEFILKMVAGILKDHSQKLNQYFYALLSPPRDLYGKYETLLLMQCLETCEWSNALNKEYLTDFKNYFIEWIKYSLEIGDMDAFANYFEKLPFLIKSIDLENLLKDSYQKIQKSSNKEKVKIKCIIITLFSKLHSVSQDVINILFDAWKGDNGLLLSAADRAIRQLASSDVKVVERLLNKEGSSEVRSFVMEFDFIFNMNGWEKILFDIKNPSEQVTDLLLSKLTQDDFGEKKYAVAILSSTLTPSRKLILALLNFIKENEFITKSSLFLSHEECIYPVICSKFMLWKWKNISILLNSEEKKLLIASLLKCISKGPITDIYDSDMGEFFKDLMKERDNLELFLNFCKNQDSEIRGAALSLLGCVEKPKIDNLKLLLDGYRVKDYRMQEGIFFALKYLAKNHGNLLKELLQNLTSYQLEDNKIVSLFLAKLSPPNINIIKFLIKMSSSIDFMSLESLQILGEMKNTDQNSTQYLIDCYKNESIGKDVKKYLLNPLGRSIYFEKEIIDILFSALMENEKSEIKDINKQKDIKRDIYKLLKERKYSSKGIESLLERSKMLNEMEVRKAALHALGGVFSPTKDTIESLLDSCNDEAKQIQDAAWQTFEDNYWVLNSSVSNKLINVVSISHDTRCAAALHILARMEDMDAEMLEFFLACYLAENSKISDTAYKILQSSKNHFAKFGKEIEKYLLRNYYTSPLKEQLIFIRLFNNLPNIDDEVIRLLLNECGNKEKDLRSFAQQALFICLTGKDCFPVGMRKHEFKYILEGGYSNSNKPLGPLMNFNPAWLKIMLDACGSPNKKIRWIAAVIINNFSNYRNNCEQLITDSSKSNNPGIRIAALNLLSRVNLSAQSTDLIDITFNEQEKEDIRVDVFYQALSLQALLEVYPADNVEISQKFRLKLLIDKLTDSLTAISENTDRSLSLTVNNMVFTIKPDHIAEIKNDLQKIRMIPALYLDEIITIDLPHDLSSLKSVIDKIPHRELKTYGLFTRSIYSLPFTEKQVDKFKACKDIQKIINKFNFIIQIDQKALTIQLPIIKFIRTQGKVTKILKKVQQALLDRLTKYNTKIACEISDDLLILRSDPLMLEAIYGLLQQAGFKSDKKFDGERKTSCKTQ